MRAVGLRGVHDEGDGDDDLVSGQVGGLTSATCTPSDNPVTFRKLLVAVRTSRCRSTRTW